MITNSMVINIYFYFYRAEDSKSYQNNPELNISSNDFDHEK